MKFEEALKAMKQGKRIARKSWYSVLGKRVCYFIKENQLRYFTGITDYEWKVLGDELLADDWEIVE